MPRQVTVGERSIGDGRPVYVIAEIGINHNGDLGLAKKMIDAAALAGCDAVKFQKRTPELCVPPNQRDVPRETPWGVMTYMQYRERMEFGRAEYREIDAYCRTKGITWFASVWDEPSVDFMEQFGPVCYKVPSACLTDTPLLQRIDATGRAVMLSTGMSSSEEIEAAVRLFHGERLLIAHATSTYPCQPSELNLSVIRSLAARFDCPIGYSGHEVGLQTTYAAVALGACFVERHLTLDRAMWGSDQAASVEPMGFFRLVRDIRVIEAAIGDGVKKVYDSELPAMKRLRRVKVMAAG
jgi:N-acetylneuraminate synthase